MADQKKPSFSKFVCGVSKEEAVNQLSPEQYRVTQKDGTEKPFENAYWDNKEEGIYVDVVTGRPLFSSTQKYDSGSGWPSFYDVIQKEHLEFKDDYSLTWHRTEIKSVDGSHLGHVFEDGPSDKTGLRYCTNSASLRFVERAKMDEEGYGEYLVLFFEASNTTA